MSEVYKTPREIEARSMEIIDAECKARGIVLSGENAPVIRRVIHTTADFDYLENLVFTPDAVSRGIDALRRGAPIITDTNMARAGISKPALGAFGSDCFCYMADPKIAAAAKAAGTTRAVASMETAMREHPDGIFAVGNAPTALFALSEYIRKGARPALVIAVPVGFVNVVEAKLEILEVCRESGVPAIAALGRKGGSTVAAAICNALLYTAAEQAGLPLR